MPEIHALEAEQALLGAMLVNNACVPNVVGTVQPEHFFHPLHARIFEAILRGVNAGNKVSAVTLAPWFRDDADLQELGGVPYLASLVANAVTVSNAHGYARMIVDTWVRRAALSVLQGLDGRLADTGWQTGEAVQAVQQGLAEIAAVADMPDRLRRQTVGRIGDTIIEEINAANTGEREINRGAAIGLTSLRHMLPAWERQNLYLIAARPSMGKTTVATSLLLRTAEKSGAHVLYFSLEMSAQQLAQRMLSDIAWSHYSPIPYQSIAHNTLTDQQFERVIDANRKLKLLPITIDDRSALTVDQMMAAAMVEKQKAESVGKRLGVVAIDHGGLIKSSGRYQGNRVNEIEDITAGLKGMAKTLDCAVLCLVQLNRGVEGRDNKRPTLSDLRGSGSWEQDADVICFLYREAYYLARAKEDDAVKDDKRKARLLEVESMLELAIDKNRMGECGLVELFTSMGSSVIRDLER